MMSSPQLTQEASLKERLTHEILPFWQQGSFASFSGISEVDIHYAFFLQEKNNSPALVIVPGRSEGYLKYQELAFDLYAQGYSIFIIDHRGQGISQRILANTHKGYVQYFQDYVDDLRYFIENIVAKHCSSRPYLLAHSMGAAIATRLMQDSPQAIKAAVISSPMLGFEAGPLPNFLAKALVKFKLTLNNLFSKTPWYFLGQKNYSPTSFSKNKLSHSALRYRVFTDLYQTNKKIQLGGVTTHWLAQCIAAHKVIFARLAKLETPIMVLQAGQDSVVCQQAQNDFCQQLYAIKKQSCPNGLPNRIDDAYHELFFESDSYRNLALTQALAWFKQHGSRG